MSTGSRKNILQRRQHALSSLDLGASYKIMEGEGVVRFPATDILNTCGIRKDINGESFRPQIILKGLSPLFRYRCFSSGLFAALMSSPFGLGFLT